ncbi:hypothetical protein L810_1159 [Burkholderia sp. AU4i]|uniref:DUF2303 family protein n=1 Tax=Burkholderia sp. AU4i TaxID=1335308 RepID=UPI0003989703|nr:DUF2303 family protein [Burkholderia sp. AU4i]ERJ35902.1 hypothetical protein L810_1159 [Burkholderia sp. AU4i]
MLEHDAPDISAALNAGTALAGAQKSPLADGTPFVVVPNGYEVQPLTDRDSFPHRPKGIVKVRDAASFIAYFNRQKMANSLIYASLDPAQVLGVIDDHFQASESQDNGGANWREYRVQFAVPASREWRVWNEVNRKQMTQLSFAEFIEDNLPDIITPSGSDMLSIALNFEASKGGNFVSATRLQDGSVDFVWREDVNATGNKVKMPTEIALELPVFENGAKYPLSARLKYRVKDGGLTIWYELVRPHKVLEDAFRAIWSDIEAQTETKILLGSPE